VSISKIRSIFYSLGKYLGDFSALKRAIENKDFAPLIKRIFNRIYGRIVGRGFRKWEKFFLLLFILIKAVKSPI